MGRTGFVLIAVLAIVVGTVINYSIASDSSHGGGGGRLSRGYAGGGGNYSGGSGGWGGGHK
ncbi:hypothetical protein [Alysiella filiformis]|uniref:Heterogeneous ribonucleoprotein A1/A3 n=1 Tax=Alysiella filiformis DSM 16848 TaxID=1120981 RepID=A0A286E9S8_9NEIS|nr:hypothetical protein [Alysiella filiformis]QMT31378.1 hypothetical protein H3L97_00200 [Alysiella filiformis]UBQ55613.1 hypothetical protein JF568_08470 [Alysiella filiformis DSM 16848]SOD67652.1 heterogeneous ribonucleoprotein A1/A3 [Alysiella filiformis DSM 16848]